MNRRMMILLSAPLLLLGGCSLIESRLNADHALVFDCDELGRHLHAYAPEGFEAPGGGEATLPAPAGVPPGSILSPQWRSDTGTSDEENRIAADTPDDPMLDAMIGRDSAGLVESTRPLTPSNVLLLSGGGQWGAFGAGFLSRLHSSGQMPDINVINGISTGAMQSLYVAAGRREDYEALRDVYLLAVSNYSRPEGSIGSLLKGRRASLAPLRTLLEGRLCPHGVDSPCPLIDAIRTSPRELFIGMVAAQSGRFSYVDVRALLRDIDAHHDNEQANVRAQQCITGVALASSSIPVMLQRVRINYLTRATSSAPSVQDSQIFYDGGTRYSVFDASIAARGQEAAKGRAATAERPALPPRDVRLFIVRNGPLSPIADPKINENGSLLAAAMRGYAILVNQSEIIAIRAMRIYRPTGEIRYVTADAYTQQCSTQFDAGRTAGLAFYHPFMECLVRLGETTASNGGWRTMD